VNSAVDPSGYDVIDVYNIDANNSLVESIPTVTDVGNIRGACANAQTGMFYFSYYRASDGDPRICALDLNTESVVWDREFDGVDRLAADPSGLYLYVPTGEAIANVDYINVVNALTGDVVRQVHVFDGSHDTQDPSGRFTYQEVKGITPYLYVIDPTTYDVSTIGPFHTTIDTTMGPYESSLAPFVMDGTERYFAVCITGAPDGSNFRGFQVADRLTGDVIDAVVPPDEMFGLSTPHGIFWSPDQTVLLQSTGEGNTNAVSVWDMADPMQPQFLREIFMPPEDYDGGLHWISGDINGDYAYIAPTDQSLPTQVIDLHAVQSGNDTYLVGQINPSQFMCEVDWNNNGQITEVGNQFGNGMVGAPPPVPANLEATAGNASVALDWTASRTATTNNVYRSTSSGNETLLATGIMTTSYIDNTVVNGTTYFYSVSAVNSSAESVLSWEVSATPTGETPIPTAPRNLSATPGDSQVLLTWEAVTGVDSYNVYRGTSSSGETLLASGVIGPTFTDTSVTDDTTYFYEVTAVNSARARDFSSGTSATPHANSGSATPVDLSSSFNRVGIVSDGSTFGGGLDENGNALSANELGASVTWNNQTKSSPRCPPPCHPA
jgi:hypothetical protein